MNVNANTNIRNGVEKHLADHLGDEGFALYAHDVRSSLFGLLGSLAIIDDSALGGEARDQLERARASGSLLSDLLDLAFGNESTQEPATPLRVHQELDSVVERWTNQATEKGVTLSVEASVQLPPLTTKDRTAFHRVFNNLVGNAIKFSDDGVIQLAAAVKGDDTLQIIVTDEGPGFSPNSLAMLFEFRGRPPDSPQVGTGLGLFISKSLVEEMGGKIWVENCDSGGGQVTVILPVTLSAKRRTVDNGLPDLSHLNILLAEDNVTNQLVVTQMLKTMGARYQVASDGVEALEMFYKANFDVVLLDIEMPRKSGLEVLREIRARDGSRANTPLVALTAYVMQEHRERIEAAGADGIIAKPIAGIAELGNMICKYVDGVNETTTVMTKVRPIIDTVDIAKVNVKIFDVLLQTIGREGLPEFLETVILDFNNISEALIQAEGRDDEKTVRANSHILISVAGAIGAQNLQHLAEDLNRAARSGNRTERQALSMVCINSIEEVVVFLQSKIISSDSL